jgi:hypothetical protein
METITTVGYGDYSGGTKAEYLFSMIVEFFGLSLCSILMFAVTKIFADEFTFEKFIEENFQRLDIWIKKVERCNKPRYINPSLCQKIRKNIENAFSYDFNVIIEEFDFYE